MRFIKVTAKLQTKIKAFGIVGDSVSPSISTKTQEDYGEVYAYAYKQLVQMAVKDFQFKR